MTAFNTGDFVHHAKHGEGEIRATYPPIKEYGEPIAIYGVSFPGKKHLTVCTEPELSHKLNHKPATEFYLNRDPLKES